MPYSLVTALDLAALGPRITELIWQIPNTVEELTESPKLPRLWWSPREGELAITCLDAAEAIGPVLRGFGGVVLASATFGPADTFAAACGLEHPPELPPPAAPELPEQERTLVAGHYFEGRRFDEVAASMGLSKSWASRLHTRAVSRLTKRLRAST